MVTVQLAWMLDRDFEANPRKYFVQFTYNPEIVTQTLPEFVFSLFEDHINKALHKLKHSIA